jgi:formiminoglutamate deiminase
MSTHWAEHVQLPGGLASRVRFEVTDGRFAAVDAGVDPESGDVRFDDGVVLPGLANAHSHAFHRALRGRTQADRGSFWTWREQMYAVANQLNPDSYLELARAVFAEMALAGMTVVGEFHYLHHDRSGRRYADPNAMGAALIQAAQEAGIRITLLDACYLSGGLDGNGHHPLDPAQQRFGDSSVAAWAERVAALPESPTARIGSALHSVRAVPEAALAEVADLAAPRPMHVHLSEQPAENHAVQAFYGCTPTQLLARHWLLGPETTAVHATHATGSDIILLGDARTTVCFCPTTERDLADGIGPARALADAGTPLCLGSDQHAVIDMFEEIRGLESHERLQSHERSRLTSDELVNAASAAGYNSLGWDGGRIAEGALADFIVVATDSVRTVGSRPDQVIHSATAADVRRVVVGGETVVSDGEHRLGPIAPLLAKALARLDDQP